MSEIRAATGEDVAAIHSLAEDWVLQDLPPSEAAEKGFLVSNFTPAEYRRFVQVANGFFVLESDGRIEAFILAYTRPRLSPGWPSTPPWSWSRKTHAPSISMNTMDSTSAMK